MSVGDTDPAHPCLLYVSNRFDLTIEQRFWFAFLYATTYCGATAYYIYNEFPDFELVDFGRLEKWWKTNRQTLVFQSDRAWIRSRDQFCDVVRSYYNLIGGNNQALFYSTLKTPDKRINYDNAFKEFSKVYQFGRFTLFNYLESVFVLTGFPMTPTGLDLKHSTSSRNGLCYALGKDEFITHRYDKTSKKKLSKGVFNALAKGFDNLYSDILKTRANDTIWNIETTLCAYKKYKKNKRWIGYYIERQRKEIARMEKNITEGVDWSVLWDFRKEYFDKKWLKEC